MPYKLKAQKDIEFPLTREDALQRIIDHLGPKDVVVGTTGMLSRELYEYRWDMSRVYLILKAPITTAADNNFCDIFLIFLKK